jgi:hypothetical protein
VESTSSLSNVVTDYVKEKRSYEKNMSAIKVNKNVKGDEK